MRPSWKILVTVAATLLAVPQLAWADAVEEQLQQMQQRMSELEDKLQATNDELETSKAKVDQQQELIEKAGIDEVRGAGSGMPAIEYLKLIEIDGFVAASFNWNFHNLGDEDTAQEDLDGETAPSTVFGENQGALGLTAPGHTNANSFQLDQLFFGIGKRATMDSNSGFQADIVYGAGADANREGTFFTEDEDDVDYDDHGTGDLPHLYQAYIEYLAPVGENGISFKAGRFATLIGAESFRQDSNFNITRGANWALQPVNHTGLIMSGKCSRCSMDWAVGVVNSYSDTMSDRDNEKGVLGGLKWSGETLSFGTNVFYGGDAGDFLPWSYVSGFDDAGTGRSGDKVGVADAVLTWNPTDRLSTWANYDYYWVHNANSDLSTVNIHTIALASRFAVTEDTGVALRGEYQWWARLGEFGSGGAKPQLSYWTVTGTIDHSLTENLILKLEGRYDIGRVRNQPDDLFLSGGDGPLAFDDNAQTLGLVQLLYKF